MARACFVRPAHQQHLPRAARFCVASRLGNLQVNEDNKPSCSKQQDEGEHTCQPHNYCSQINPIWTQEKNCTQSPERSSLIVSSSHLEVWRNIPTKGFLATPNKNTFFQKIQSNWSELDFQKYQTDQFCIPFQELHDYSMTCCVATHRGSETPISPELWFKHASSTHCMKKTQQILNYICIL